MPILPSHDPPATVAFFERLGFFTNRGSDADYVMVERERDRAPLHARARRRPVPYRRRRVRVRPGRRRVPRRDRRRGRAGVGGVPARRPPLRAALGDDACDLSRVGPPEDKPWRVREFALADPTNNLPAHRAADRPQPAPGRTRGRPEPGPRSQDAMRPRIRSRSRRCCPPTWRDRGTSRSRRGRGASGPRRRRRSPRPSDRGRPRR